jgi:hypothetical protein
MTGLLDTAIGDRGYLNGGQLLYALPREPGLSRVRVRFRRLTTSPGLWSSSPGDASEETCRATLYQGGEAKDLHFLMRTDLTLRRGGQEPSCFVKLISSRPGRVVPLAAEADFEGPIWSATILLSKIIGPPTGSGRTWVPTFVEGGGDLLDPTPRRGRISLSHLRDRLGVSTLLIHVNGEPFMEFGVIMMKTE